MHPWHHVLLVANRYRLRVWLAVPHARGRGQRYFIEWDGWQWLRIED